MITTRYPSVLTNVVVELAHHHAATAEHCERVATYSEALALRFGSDELLARSAGLGHDLGKLDVSVRCLDSTDFGPAERTEMQIHPLAGFRRLCAIGLWEQAAVAGLHHIDQPGGYGITDVQAFAHVDAARVATVREVTALVHLADYADALFTRNHAGYGVGMTMQERAGFLRSQFPAEQEQVDLLIAHII